MKAYVDSAVPVGRSKDAIDNLLTKHGVDAIRWTALPDRAVLEFKSPEGSFAMTARYDLGDAKLPDQRERQVLRALHWYVKAKLEAVDFAPFRALTDMPMAMTAHLVYTAIDPSGPATTSSRVIGDIIRGAIGFEGLLMTISLVFLLMDVSSCSGVSL